MPEGLLLPCYPCVVTPEGTVRTQSNPLLYQATSSGRIRAWIPASTPTMASPSSLVPNKKSVAAGAKKRCRRALNLKEITAILQNSGSDAKTKTMKMTMKVTMIFRTLFVFAKQPAIYETCMSGISKICLRMMMMKIW